MNKLEQWALAKQKHEGFYPGSRSYRNNNPGNLRYTSYSASLGTNKGKDDKNFVIYESYEIGFNALKQFLRDATNDELRSYRGSMTLLEFYGVYAPSADGNNPKNYATAIANELGVTIYTRIKDIIGEENPTKKPSDILNLENWKLTLPEGNPTEVLSLHGYSDDNFFVKGDGVVFRAPVNGATTSGSKYPRCELREMNGTEKAGWSTQEKHVIIIEQAITQLPAKKKDVVAGQIHGENDDILMIRLEDKKLFIEADGREVKVLDEDYVLGTLFSIEFKVGDGRIEVYYNKLFVYALKINASGCYFKAGCYTQSNCDKEDVCSEDNFGEVIIYNISLQEITPEPEPVLFSKCPRCGYPDSLPDPTPIPENNSIPLKYYWQRHPRYNGLKIGHSNTSFQLAGCYTHCLAWVAGIDPLLALKMLTDGGGYNGDLINSQRAAEILGLDLLPGNSNIPGKMTDINYMPEWSPCIKESKIGRSQHFVVRLIGDHAMASPTYKTYIFDPWEGKFLPINHYKPFVSYRLFKKK